MSVASLFVDACRAELAAPKPGNIHGFADGHGATIDDFMRSADVAAEPLCREGASLGARILGAVSATQEAVGRNTNLGIVLLCAPLAMAAELAGGAMAAELAGVTLSAAVERVINQAGVEDAAQAFAAIALASPGGLGDAPEHDVHAPAIVPLVVAMRAAATRDMIARQYASGFADVFGAAMDVHVASQQRWDDSYWATEALYLHFLARFPDSHVVRYYGEAAAAAVQTEARVWQSRLLASDDPSILLPGLLSWDAALKRDGINPGTSADLTVATIFAASLQAALP